MQKRRFCFLNKNQFEILSKRVIYCSIEGVKDDFSGFSLTAIGTFSNVRQGSAQGIYGSTEGFPRK